ncbi:MAG: hypothetical protein HY760_07940, partial [Nitrospirae bacterium]|nr:hypothetical protein [Nitrospirota bacterium]
MITGGIGTNQLLTQGLGASVRSYQGIAGLFHRIPSLLVIFNLDYCDRTFGTSPCLATGTPCYNTWPTCKYPSAYATSAGKDYKFCLKDNPTPLPGQIIRPYIEEISYLGQEILPTEALTLNQKLTLTMADEPDNDVGIDPYRVSPSQRSAPGGSANVAAGGTFWTKLKARNSNYKNRRVTVKKGFIAGGFTEGDYQTYFVGILENIEIDGHGKVKITVKGLLGLTDINLPKKTDGRLSAEISAAATSFALAAWTGVDRSVNPSVSQYASSGYLKIDTEIFSYSSVSLDTATGITTFSGASRGLYNGDGWSQAAVHAADAQVQQVEILDGNPMDLIHTLLNKAGISDTDIDVAKFTFERDNWFPGVQFRGVLHEPKKIKEYLKELREQTLTSLWQGDDQKITIRSMNPNLPGQSYTQIKDVENIIFQSRHVDDRESLRITRVPIYYDLFAGKSGGSLDDFARAAVAIDADAEAANRYNEIRWRDPIYSRWLRSSLVGNDYVRILATRITRRFRDGEKQITFDLELKDETLGLGEIFELVTADIVDFDGNAKTV